VDDKTIAGPAARPGRWNDVGEPVVYCAPAIARAVLEPAAHVHDVGLPFNRFLVRIDVPYAVGLGAARKAAAKWISVVVGAQHGGAAAVGNRFRGRIALISPRHADAAKMSGLGHSTIRLQRVFRGRMI
jgi:hypothetical protein